MNILTKTMAQYNLLIECYLLEPTEDGLNDIQYLGDKINAILSNILMKKQLGRYKYDQ